MRNTITRTIRKNVVHGYIIKDVDGVPTPTPIDPVEMFGTVTKKSAEKLLKKEFGKDEHVIVGKIESTDELYGMSIDDFVKYAKPVENETENEEKEVI